MPNISLRDYEKSGPFHLKYALSTKGLSAAKDIDTFSDAARNKHYFIYANMSFIIHKLNEDGWLPIVFTRAEFIPVWDEMSESMGISGAPQDHSDNTLDALISNGYIRTIGRG